MDALDSQSVEIIRIVTNAFMRGALRDTGRAMAFCELLALICEGSILVDASQEDGALRIFVGPNADLDDPPFEFEPSGNLIKGPWPDPSSE